MIELTTLKAGDVFAGRYRVRGLLRAGGMGAVYDAVDSEERTGRRVALKLMRPDVVADADARARFLREARVAAQIDSSYVVSVLDSGVDPNGVPYLVMEFLVGIEVGDLLAQRGRLPPHEVVSILSQVARALDKAHAKNIVHRDLKPENLFLVLKEDEPPMVKVLDFGIAKVREAGVEQSTRATGTPLYMAPEQTQRSVDVGPGTDVWALALLSYTLLVGRTYWQSVDDRGMVNLQHLFREVLVTPFESPTERARRLGITLPPAYDAWFFTCVEREPARRVARASQAVAGLAAAFGAASDGGRAPAISPLEASGRIEAQTVLAAPPTMLAGDMPRTAVGTGTVMGEPGTGTMRLQDPLPHATHIAPQHAAAAHPAPPMPPHRPVAAVSASQTLPASSLGDHEAPRRSGFWLFVVLLLLLGGGGAGTYFALFAERGHDEPKPPPPPNPLDDDDDPKAAKKKPKKPGPLPLPALVAKTNALVTVGSLGVQEHEVTRGEYASYLATLAEADRPAQRPLGWSTDSDPDPDLPVSGVDWEQASGFCTALGARLPTHEEFTAALGDPLFPPSTEGLALGAPAGTAPFAVETKPNDRTKDGVRDLAGNVEEWTVVLLEGGTAGVRGGSVAMSPLEALAAIRGPGRVKPKTTRSPTLGFRCYQ